MIVILVTRCGCRKTQEIQASEAPPGIVLELDVPAEYPGKSDRRFSYVGDDRVSSVPVYLEDIEQFDSNVVDGEVIEQPKLESDHEQE